MASAKAPKETRPTGSPMTLGNMRELGVQRLIASYLNDACRHTALIEAGTEIPSLGPEAVIFRLVVRRLRRDGQTALPTRF